MPEHDVAALSDIPDGLSKVEAGDRAMLLVRQGDDVRAFTHECPHLGLPLSKGVLRDGTVICPFHHACFDAATGQQAEPPGHGDLARFAVALRDGRVLVDVPDGIDPHPLPDTATPGPDARRMVVVGAGAAAHACVAALREEGFDGAIEMIAPNGPPLDRTMLSKAVLTGGKQVEDLTLRPTIKGLNVVHVEDRVTAVSEGRLTLASGGTRAFDGLLVAPGGLPRGLDLPGEDLPGIYRLRDGDQATALAEAAEGASRAVVIGGGFIGLEAALSLSKRGVKVTLATREALPLARIVGEEIARLILSEVKEAGIHHTPRTEARLFHGTDRVTAVELKDGGRTETDLVLVAVGVSPATAGIEGLPLDDDGGVSVGPDLSVPGLAGVHVAGDCASTPTPFGPARIEHWRVACQHGKRAARAMLGHRADPADIPFFWTALARQYRYLGHATDWDEIRIDGDPSGPFMARYVKEGQVIAALTAGRDADLADLHLQMRAAGGPVPA
ncbi:FAD-dependent oxidoreductase [Jannaschia aquimarina]|uniref:Fdr protein n=1 Tax=Jannaschia aquimarina TaxID=935700 RepID=A0A0D1EAW5_9RHOB|nr:FAD-dependent oxidoreductase [Jannaschia aquimarina]KIT14864.1 Ferredoxin--NAD(P)(+) reductase fdr [Jannaschia aquimarina]SNS57849.1 NADPH-dependent 2,4-dienoyl-CoA reductase, sulfur reductase [Jannaschia aquimarina]